MVREPAKPSRSRVKSYLLVSAQMISLGGILLTGPLIAEHWITLVMEFLGIGLGGWALATMSLRRLHVFPEVKPGSQLVTRGPYRWIRHPMYSALLLATLALVCDHWSLVRFGLWLALSIVLVAKLQYEEALLREAFPDYPSYERQTYRLIPFLY